MSRMVDQLSPGEAKRRAIEMYAGGWKPAEIQRYLAARGATRSRNTIHRWVNPDYDERARERGTFLQRQYRKTEVAKIEVWTSDHIRRAVCALRGEKLSVNAIIGAMRIMAGVELKAHHVRLILDDGAVA